MGRVTVGGRRAGKMPTGMLPGALLRHGTETIDVATLLRERDWLRRLARGLTGDPAFAEDAVQETYLAALRHPPPRAGGLDPRVARHRAPPPAGQPRPARPPARAAGARRRGQRRKRTDGGGRRRGARAGGADRPARAATPRRRPSCSSCPRPSARPCSCARPTGSTSTEAAARLGVPAGTVRWRVKQALDLLRADLDRQHGGDRRAWRLVCSRRSRPSRWRRKRARTAAPADPADRRGGPRLGKGPAPRSTCWLELSVCWPPRRPWSTARGRPPAKRRGARSVSCPAVAREPLHRCHRAPGGPQRSRQRDREPEPGRCTIPEGRPVPGALVSHRRVTAPHELVRRARRAAPALRHQRRRRPVPHRRDLPPGRTHPHGRLDPRRSRDGETTPRGTGEAAVPGSAPAPGGVLLEGRLRDQAAGAVAGGRVLLAARFGAGWPSARLPAGARRPTTGPFACAWTRGPTCWPPRRPDTPARS